MIIQIKRKNFKDWNNELFPYTGFLEKKLVNYDAYFTGNYTDRMVEFDFFNEDEAIQFILKYSDHIEKVI